MENTDLTYKNLMVHESTAAISSAQENPSFKENSRNKDNYSIFPVSLRLYLRRKTEETGVI